MKTAKPISKLDLRRLVSIQRDLGATDAINADFLKTDNLGITDSRLYKAGLIRITVRACPGFSGLERKRLLTANGKRAIGV
jgi:hypothetical protein